MASDYSIAYQVPLSTPISPNPSSPPEDLILRLQKGEESLRENLIESHWHYISTQVSAVIGKPCAYSDEFSIGLQAFNEALDAYQSDKGASFLYFAKMVINRRVIDYIRKNKKFNQEYPFTYFEVADNEDYFTNLYEKQPDYFAEKTEMAEEIAQFQISLKDYQISFESLINKAPKHYDTKQLCITMAKKIIENPNLSFQLVSTKKLPVAELTKIYHVNRKTVEKHRSYIIALYLILSSDMDVIKSYATFLLKGVI